MLWITAGNRMWIAHLRPASGKVKRPHRWNLCGQWWQQTRSICCQSQTGWPNLFSIIFVFEFGIYSVYIYIAIYIYILYILYSVFMDYHLLFAQGQGVVQWLLDVAGMSSCFPLGEKFVTASCDEIRAEVDIYDFNGAWTGDSWSWRAAFGMIKASIRPAFGCIWSMSRNCKTWSLKHSEATLKRRKKRGGFATARTSCLPIDHWPFWNSFTQFASAKTFQPRTCCQIWWRPTFSPPQTCSLPMESWCWSSQRGYWFGTPTLVILASSYRDLPSLVVRTRMGWFQNCCVLRVLTMFQILSPLFSWWFYRGGYFGPDCTSHPNSISEEEKLHPVQARSSGASTLALWAEEGGSLMGSPSRRLC